MTLGHEKLDIYRLSSSCVAWVYERAKGLAGGASTRARRLGGRGYQVREEQEDFGADPDSDFDLDGEDKEPQPSVPGDA